MFGYKKIGNKVLFLFFSIVIIFGIIEIFNSFTSRSDITENGIDGMVHIDSLWRSRCGSGYGNSVLFTLDASDSIYFLESRCNIPREVDEGDSLKIKYLKKDPIVFYLLFD